MQEPLNDAVEAFTREAVSDVFKKMLTLDVQSDEPTPLDADADGQIVGSVGFIGQATGIIYLYAGAKMGRTVTCRMLGLEEAEVDDAMVNDAFGELCNMVVGSVKSRLCDRGWPCVLTIPSIMRGNELRIETVTDVKRTALGFRAADQRLIVDIGIKDLKPKA